VLPGVAVASGHSGGNESVGPSGPMRGPEISAYAFGIPIDCKLGLTYAAAASPPAVAAAAWMTRRLVAVPAMPEGRVWSVLVGFVGVEVMVCLVLAAPSVLTTSMHSRATVEKRLSEFVCDTVANPVGRPRSAPDVTTYELDDDLVLYDARTTQAHVLNASAARIWQLCDGSRSPLALALALSTTFDLDPSRARADVDELVASLTAAGLLTLI
jgi:PqqD family protein of HPr-rel-A system